MKYNYIEQVTIIIMGKDQIKNKIKIEQKG